MGLKHCSDMIFQKDNVVISPIDYRANKGEAFIVSKTFNSVDDGDTVYVRHISGSNKTLKSVVSIETVGQWNFTSYTGTTYSSNGTLLTPINRQAGATYSPEVLFYSDSIVNTIGATRLSFTFGTGTTPARTTSGSFSDGTASIFPSTTDVLVGLTNNSGSSQYITIRYDFYEE